MEAEFAGKRLGLFVAGLDLVQPGGGRVEADHHGNNNKDGDDDGDYDLRCGHTLSMTPGVN